MQDAISVRSFFLSPSVAAWAYLKPKMGRKSEFGECVSSSGNYVHRGLRLPRDKLSEVDLDSSWKMVLHLHEDVYHPSDYCGLSLYMQGTRSRGCIQLTHATAPEAPTAALRQNPMAISYSIYWIRGCMSNHKACAALSVNIPLFPTRINT
jgi:hypothetical protein